MKLRHFFLPFCIVILTGCVGTSSPLQRRADANIYIVDAQADYPDQYVLTRTSQTVNHNQPPADVWERIRRGFAIPNLQTPLVDRWTAYYTARPEALQRITTRSSKYLYHITDEINRRGMPTELALLPFVESAYDPTALSPKKAAGLWQFLPATGHHFNLKQDWWRDERRDPVASTTAALDFLAALYELRSDWYLALASYNWGPNSVQRAVVKNEVAGRPTDYLSLSLPDETRNYVPKLQALKNIIANPEKFAVVLPPIDNTPYFATLHKTRNMDVALAARLAEMSITEFKALNPSFNRPVTRIGRNTPLRLPTQRVAIFNTNLKNYKGKLATWKIYQPQRRDSYADIARRFSISEETLRKVNGISPHRKRVILSYLLVPSHSNTPLMASDRKRGGTGKNRHVKLAAMSTPPETVTSIKINTSPTNVVYSNARRHKVQAGDSLYSVAKRYSTSVTTLRTLNNIKGTHLKVGSTLRLPYNRARS